mmetsp:Transcript_31309/g.47921  ORF Transcript_31309/g.47921 Transcript_31309/m.47921 type:complete len:187 (+) Transcript_31309:97-657(+)
MTDTKIHDVDVLCGRGGATNNHVGNRSFRSVVAEYQAEYLKAKKRDKAGIAREIVRKIRKNGGRFLKKMEDGSDRWIDVGDKKACEKTSQALREGLEVRNHMVKGKMPRRDSESSGENRPSKKTKTTDSNRLGTVVPSVKEETIRSPTLVNEPLFGTVEVDTVQTPSYKYVPSTVTTADCSEVASV